MEAGPSQVFPAADDESISQFQPASMRFTRQLMAASGALGCVLVLLCLVTASHAAERPLTNIAAVLTLPPERASAELPVHVTAVVTYADPSSGLLFVQDDTGGI